MPLTAKVKLQQKNRLTSVKIWIQAKFQETFLQSIEISETFFKQLVQLEFTVGRFVESYIKMSNTNVGKNNYDTGKY